MRVRKSLVKTLFLPVILLLMSFGCATTQITKEPVTLLTDDQTKLASTYYPPRTPNAPVLFYCRTLDAIESTLVISLLNSTKLDLVSWLWISDIRSSLRGREAYRSR